MVIVVVIGSNFELYFEGYSELYYDSLWTRLSSPRDVRAPFAMRLLYEHRGLACGLVSLGNSSSHYSKALTAMPVLCSCLWSAY